jgi:hypothetical protein
MRATFNIDGKRLEKASRMAGVTGKTAVYHNVYTKKLDKTHIDC